MDDEYRKFIENCQLLKDKLKMPDAYDVASELAEIYPMNTHQIQNFRLRDKIYSGVFLSAAINKSPDREFVLERDFHEGLSYIGMKGLRGKKIILKRKGGDFIGYQNDGSVIRAELDVGSHFLCEQERGYGMALGSAGDYFCEGMVGGRADARRIVGKDPLRNFVRGVVHIQETEGLQLNMGDGRSMHFGGPIGQV